MVFIGLAIRKGVRSRPDLASKEGSLVDQWHNRRARLYLIMFFYVCVLYVGGLTGAVLANKGVETSFIAFVLASILGQSVALAMVSVSIAMLRGIWSLRSMGRPLGRHRRR